MQMAFASSGPVWFHVSSAVNCADVLYLRTQKGARPVDSVVLHVNTHQELKTLELQTQ